MKFSADYVNWICRLLSTRGSVSLSSIPDERLSLITRTDCGITCKFIWDGRGRWVQNTWKPHVKGTWFKMILSICVFIMKVIWPDGKLGRPHIKLDKMVVFGESGNRCIRRRNQQTQPTDGVPFRIEPGSYWWKANALTAAPTLPLLQDATNRSLNYNWMVLTNKQKKKTRRYWPISKYSFNCCWF